jgi:hypothetical protein
MEPENGEQKIKIKVSLLCVSEVYTTHVETA